jgi:hypothetical protein
MEHRNTTRMGNVFASHYIPGIHHQAWCPVDDWYHHGGPGSGGKTIEFTIISVSVSTDPDYAPLNVASVLVRGGPPDLVGEIVDVIDHSGQLFDIESMNGYTGWAHWVPYVTMDTEKPCDELTPHHWAAINRVCEPNQGTYRECEEDEE